MHPRFGIGRGVAAVLSMVLAACGGGSDSDTRPRTGFNLTQQQLQTPVNGARDYVLYLPPDYGLDPERAWPLTVYLHGSADDPTMSLVSSQGMIQSVARRGEPSPAIIVAPQQNANVYGHKHAWHDPNFIDAVIRDVQQRYKVDATRVTLSGISLGGFGAWATALAFPKRFAGVMPVVGGLSNDTDTWERQLPITNAADWGGVFANIAQTPFRVYAGSMDESVFPEWARNPVTLLQQANGNLDYRELALDHFGAQSVAYQAEPVDWLLTRSRPDADPNPLPIPSPSDYVGTYRAADGTVVNVTSGNGKLVLDYGTARQALSFYHIGNDRFIATWLIVALRDSQNQVKCISTPLRLLPTYVRIGASESCL